MVHAWAMLRCTSSVGSTQEAIPLIDRGFLERLQPLHQQRPPEPPEQTMRISTARPTIPVPPLWMFNDGGGRSIEKGRTRFHQQSLHALLAVGWLPKLLLLPNAADEGPLMRSETARPAGPKGLFPTVTTVHVFVPARLCGMTSNDDGATAFVNRHPTW